MSTYDVCISHAPADEPLAGELEHQLRALAQASGPAPAWPDGRCGVVLLSPAWLDDEVCVRQWAEAQAARRPVWVVVHPDIAREATDSVSRGRLARLHLALAGHPVEGALRAQRWVWLRAEPGAPVAWAQLAPIAPSEPAAEGDGSARLSDGGLPAAPPARWAGPDAAGPAASDEALGRALEEVLGQAPHPALRPEERAWVRAAHQAQAAQCQRLAALCWGAQAQAAALAAQQHTEQQPDLALALAAAAADVADLPATRQTLLRLLTRYNGLQRVLTPHEDGRPVCSLAFSPDGQWLATADTRSRSQPDDARPARLNLLHLETMTVRAAIPTRAGQIGALAWGRPWLARGTRGSLMKPRAINGIERAR